MCVCTFLLSLWRTPCCCQKILRKTLASDF